MTDPDLDRAHDAFLDHYGFEGEAREQALQDFQRFAEVMARIASRLAREGDSPD